MFARLRLRDRWSRRRPLSECRSVESAIASGAPRDGSSRSVGAFFGAVAFVRGVSVPCLGARRSLDAILVAGLVCVLASLSAGRVFGQSPPTPTVVQANLNSPWGVAIQPETNLVFVAESGAGRVIRMANGAVEPVFTGFATLPAGPGGAVKLGPTSLAFLAKNELLVNDGGAPAQPSLRFFAVPDPGQPPVGLAGNVQHVIPVAGEAFSTKTANFGGLAAPGPSFYVAYPSEDGQGRIARCVRAGAKWGDLRAFVGSQQSVGIGGPAALAVSSRNELVVGEAGTMEDARDSLLTFYHAMTGQVLWNQPTGLRDVVALAYSPKTSQLYALDVAWSTPDDAGLYQLVSVLEAGRVRIDARRIAKLDRPAAMVFAADGRLLVTELGPPSGGSATAGRLLQFPAGL